MARRESKCSRFTNISMAIRVSLISNSKILEFRGNHKFIAVKWFSLFAFEKKRRKCRVVFLKCVSVSSSLLAWTLVGLPRRMALLLAQKRHLLTFDPHLHEAAHHCSDEQHISLPRENEIKSRSWAKNKMKCCTFSWINRFFAIQFIALFLLPRPARRHWANACQTKVAEKPSITFIMLFQVHVNAVNPKIV